MRMSRAALVIAVLTATLAVGHEPSQHKGKPVEGKVISVEGDRLTLQTAAGPVTVTLADTTEFERGDAAATRDALTRGVDATVFGTKLPGGEMVARHVVVRSPAPETPAGHAGH